MASSLSVDDLPPGLPPDLPVSVLAFVAELPPSVQQYLAEKLAEMPPMSAELKAEIRLAIWGSRALAGPAPLQQPARRARPAESLRDADAGVRSRADAPRQRPAVHVYTAEEAAEILKCTPNWLKEHARKRKIPFTMIGGAYRWTDAHLAEIIRLGEQQPQPTFPARSAARPKPQAADAVPALRFRPSPRRRQPPRQGPVPT